MITLRLITYDRHPQKIRIDKKMSIDDAAKLICEKYLDQELINQPQFQYRGHNLKDPHPFENLPDYSTIIFYQDLTYSERKNRQRWENEEMLNRLGEIFNNDEDYSYYEDDNDNGIEEESGEENENEFQYFQLFNHPDQEEPSQSPAIPEDTASRVWSLDSTEQIITQHLNSIQYEAIQDESNDFYNTAIETEDISRRINDNISNIVQMQVHHLTHPAYPDMEESELFNRMCIMLDVDIPQAYESEEIAQLEEMTKEQRQIVDRICERGFDINLAIQAAIDSNFDLQKAIEILTPIEDID